MPIQVFHATALRSFSEPFAEFTPENFTHVADVDTDDLEVAYDMTQSVDAPWTKNPGVTTPKMYPHYRSSSVGDVFVDADGKAHRVDRTGFTPVSVNVKL
jgi:hypothetical protein